MAEVTQIYNDLLELVQTTKILINDLKSSKEKPSRYITLAGEVIKFSENTWGNKFCWIRPVKIIESVPPVFRLLNKEDQFREGDLVEFEWDMEEGYLGMNIGNPNFEKGFIHHANTCNKDKAIKIMNDARSLLADPIKSLITRLEKICDSLDEIYEKNKTINTNLEVTQREIEIKKDNILQEEQSLNKVKITLKNTIDYAFNLGIVSQEQATWLVKDLLGVDKNAEENNKPANHDMPKGVLSWVARKLETAQLKFELSTVWELLAAIDTHFLILLSGPPGSGKTELARSLKSTIGANVEVIPVRPNWHSPVDLLGYYDPIARKARITPFVKAVLKAQADPTRLHVICLDEMNLAPVEHYFADILSAIEYRCEIPEIDLDYELEETGSVQPQQGRNLMESLKKLEELVTYDQDSHESVTSTIQHFLDMLNSKTALNVPVKANKLLIPSNVRIIGTVNIDESTRFFSPRLIDRSIVIRIDNPLLFNNLPPLKMEIIEDPSEPVFPLNPESFAERLELPVASDDSLIVQRLKNWNTEFFSKFGWDTALGMRRLRQSVLLDQALTRIYAQSTVEQRLDVILRTLIFPKFVIDLGTEPDRSGDKKELLNEFVREIGTQPKAMKILESMIDKSRDAINYWLY